jgi:putative transcriptional regulator
MTKTMGKTYRSEGLAAIHEAASDLHDAEVMDKRTMRRFDGLCLTPVRPLEASEIRALRERERVSQTVFARHLNVTAGLVSQWERGEKKPAGASLKLLTLVQAKGLDAIA